MKSSLVIQPKEAWDLSRKTNPKLLIKLRDCPAASPLSIDELFLNLSSQEDRFGIKLCDSGFEALILALRMKRPSKTKKIVNQGLYRPIDLTKSGKMKSQILQIATIQWNKRAFDTWNECVKYAISVCKPYVGRPQMRKGGKFGSGTNSPERMEKALAYGSQMLLEMGTKYAPISTQILPMVGWWEKFFTQIEDEPETEYERKLRIKYEN